MTATTVTPPLARSAARKGPPRGPAWLAALAGLPLVAAGWPLALGDAITGALGGPVPLATAAGGAVLLVVGVCSVTDLRWYKIYNWVTYPALLWAALFSMLGAWAWPADWQARLGTITPSNALLGAVVGLGGMLVGYHLSGGGAGDVKLAAALGAWLGPERAVHLLVGAYAIGGVVCLSLAIWKAGVWHVLGGLLRRAGSAVFPGWVAPPSEEQLLTLRWGVPMSAFFAAAAVAVLLGWPVP